MKRLLKLIKYICLLLVILIVLSFVIVPGKFGKLHGPYDVIRVIDGDTLIADIEGKEVILRFCNLDTPESKNPNESKNTPEGKVASNYTKELLTGKKIYVEYAIDRTDKYGRTLAYLYTEDKECVQTLILRDGMAGTLFIFPNHLPYALYFKRIEITARLKGEGFWY